MNILVDEGFDGAYNMTNNKRDVIEAVREGAKIEVYEAGRQLKEGDIIRNWQVYKKEQAWEDRRVLGKPAYTLGLSLVPVVPMRCEYCNTHMHQEIDENRKKRIGRDGRVYYKYWNRHIGYICPLCEYRKGKD